MTQQTKHTPGPWEVHTSDDIQFAQRPARNCRGGFSIMRACTLLPAPPAQKGGVCTSFCVFECDVTIKPYHLTRQTREQIDASLRDLAECPGAHTHFDVCDNFGQVAAVYLFQKDGKLFARGDRYTSVLRDPADVYRLLPRSKRVKSITLIIWEGAQ